MNEFISILEVIKRGGYEASLITTFNAALPFYEEVVLRKLVAAGCRHNVVLMDRAQCAISWSSEATRPRLAGHAYTLLPIAAPGAFHPKVCIFVGSKKASILIGSHNLTLSGFGYNRELTNWIEVAGPKDAEGAGVLTDAWRMASQWIEMERGYVSDSLLESALSLVDFIAPLVANAEPTTNTVALSHGPSTIPLIDQIAEKISRDVSRIGIVGAFFDKNLTFVGDVARRWPEAQLVVGIDPDSVQMLAAPAIGVARYVDARKLWPDRQAYLHAKMIWFDSGDDRSAFLSGSANPSQPAWMGPTASSNVEAVLLRLGSDAQDAASAIGLHGLFDLEELAPEIFQTIAERSAVEVDRSDSVRVPLWTGVSIGEAGEIRIGTRHGKLTADRSVLFDADMKVIGEIECLQVVENELVLVWSGDIARVRSCLLYSLGNIVARVMIHHPERVSASSQPSRQDQIRHALGGLGASEGDISKLIASVERVIFSEETHKEVESVLRKHTETRSGKGQVVRPASLAIDIVDLPGKSKKLRLLRSGDLSYLLDVLLRRLSEGLHSTPSGIDARGFTEEELVGTDGSEEVRPPEYILPRTNLTDSKIAESVAKKTKALTRQMVKQLGLASADRTRGATAMLQLVAVIALVRELRLLNKTPRWKDTGQRLVEDETRRYLLEESLKHVLGATSRMLELTSGNRVADTEEATELRVLLLWLAWDLGEELTDEIGRIWDASTLQSKLRTNAMFLRLVPPIAKDRDACSALAESIYRTIRPVPEVALRAKSWMERHMRYGAAWAKGVSDAKNLCVGGYCRLQGAEASPHVVLELSEHFVEIWDYDRTRRFARDRVVAVTPLAASP